MEARRKSCIVGKMLIYFNSIYNIRTVRGHSQTTLTRRGGYLVSPKISPFVNIYKVENVSAGG